MSTFPANRVDACVYVRIPNHPCRTWHDKTLTPLTALYKLTRIGVREVELPGGDVRWGTRVVVSAVVAPSRRTGRSGCGGGDRVGGLTDISWRSWRIVARVGDRIPHKMIRTRPGETLAPFAALDVIVRIGVGEVEKSSKRIRFRARIVDEAIVPCNEYAMTFRPMFTKYSFQRWGIELLQLYLKGKSTAALSSRLQK